MSTVKNYKFYNNSIYHFPGPLYPGHPHTIWLLPRHHHLLAALLSSFETHQIPDHPKIRDLPRYSGDRSRLPVLSFPAPSIWVTPKASKLFPRYCHYLPAALSLLGTHQSSACFPQETFQPPHLAERNRLGDSTELCWSRSLQLPCLTLRSGTSAQYQGKFCFKLLNQVT